MLAAHRERGRAVGSHVPEALRDVGDADGQLVRHAVRIPGEAHGARHLECRAFDEGQWDEGAVSCVGRAFRHET